MTTEFHNLSTREIGDISTALGQFARTVRTLADAQESIADGEADQDKAKKTRETARSNRRAADEIEQTKAKFARALRVELEVWI